MYTHNPRVTFTRTVCMNVVHSLIFIVFVMICSATLCIQLYINLWKNDYKKAENHPDLKGKIMVDGVEYEIAAWSRKRESTGDKYLSLSVQLPRARQGE